MKPMTSAGGWKAIGYSLQTANRVGWTALWRAMRSNNACKTCVLGMGGQRRRSRGEPRFGQRQLLTEWERDVDTEAKAFAARQR